MSRAVGTLAAIFVFAAGPAGAQEDGARREAEAMFREANRLLHEGDYDGAIELYERAYARLPSTRILVNMATAEKARGRLVEAADLYARVIAAPPSEVSPESREEAQRIVRSLDLELGRLRILVAVDGATVRVDDREVGRTPIEAPVHVQPGQHLVSVEREGFRAATSRAVVSAGEVADVSIVLVEIPDLAAATPAAAEEDDAAHRGSGSILRRWWFWAGIGVVAGAAVGAIVLAGGSD